MRHGPWVRRPCGRVSAGAVSVKSTEHTMQDGERSHARTVWSARCARCPQVTGGGAGDAAAGRATVLAKKTDHLRRPLLCRRESGPAGTRCWECVLKRLITPGIEMDGRLCYVCARAGRLLGLVHLLHLAPLVAALLQGGHVGEVVVAEGGVLVDGEAQLDHAVDAAGEGVGLIQGEAGG
jgi:hypothetical protein